MDVPGAGFYFTGLISRTTNSRGSSRMSGSTLSLIAGAAEVVEHDSLDGRIKLLRIAVVEGL